MVIFFLVGIAGCSEVETKRISVVKEVPFKTVKEIDDSLGPGQTKVKVAGEKGFKRVTYEIILEGDDEKSRKVEREKIIKKPVDQVILTSPADAVPGSKGND